MTNEEKAKELQLDYIRNGCGDSTDIRSACEEMAEWKDQQFKEYLDSKAICAKEKRDADNLYGCDWDKWDDIYSAYMQIINELFWNKRYETI